VGLQPAVIPLAWGLLFAALAAAGNLLGGYVVWRTFGQKRLLETLLAIGAGFMLGAVVLEMIPHSLELPGPRTYAPYLVLGGFLLVQLSEHTVSPHFHFGEETHREIVHGSHLGTAAMVGLGIHCLFDGVSIGSAFALWDSSHALGLLVFAAIALHKIPEGFTMASITLASGRPRSAALGSTIALAAATLLGALVSGLLAPSAAPYALALSAGVTIYVAATDLIPEVNAHHGVRGSLLIFAGVAVFWLSEQLLHLVGVD
jgi:ZIP family zinc transporter/zinc and cadmium transporter